MVKQLAQEKQLSAHWSMEILQLQSVTLMAGLSEDKDNLLGSIGANAFSLFGAKATTTFTALEGSKAVA